MINEGGYDINVEEFKKFDTDHMDLLRKESQKNKDLYIKEFKEKSDLEV